jgi:predicted nucleic acid-binding protein
MRAALDTNILVYAEGLNDSARMSASRDLIRRLPAPGIVIPVQVLGELSRVMRRKSGLARGQAAARVDRWRGGYQTADTTATVFADAADLALKHDIDIWDAVVLSAAHLSNCRLLLSEDFQDGFVWRGCTVANPFADKLHPLLASALNH